MLKKKKVRRTYTFDEDVILRLEKRCKKELRPVSTVINQTVMYMTQSKVPTEELISKSS
jgi:hypothetical protein